jgi:glycosyltransferase involved in cell wall biosynthesis
MLLAHVGGYESNGERGEAMTAAIARLRVAMVIQRFRPQFSGQGIQVELLCRELARRGHDVTVITIGSGSSSGPEEIDGYRVVRLRCDVPAVAGTRVWQRLRGAVFAARTLAYLSLRADFDLVHTHAMTDALGACWLWCRWRRRPLLFETTLAGADDPVTLMHSRHYFHKFRWAIFRRCDGYVAISPALTEKYLEAGFASSQVRLISQGVDIRDFAPSDDQAGIRRQLGLPADNPILVFVGSLIYRKGIDVLLQAWARIHASLPDAHLVLLGKNVFPGDPGASHLLAREMAELPAGAAARVHQVGITDDVSRYLQAANVFVFPSRQEGFGTVMIEAMACGVPSVVAELPGITDFIFGVSAADPKACAACDSEPAAGIVVPQEDAEALARAAIRLLSNPSGVAAAGRAARSRACASFSIERIADSYLDYYAHLLEQRRRRQDG